MARVRSPQTSAAGLLLGGGAFAVFVAGILFINHDPALAGPGAEDPRPVALAIVTAGAGAVVAGFVLAWRG